MQVPFSNVLRDDRITLVTFDFAAGVICNAGTLGILIMVTCTSPNFTLLPNVVMEPELIIK